MSTAPACDAGDFASARTSPREYETALLECAEGRSDGIAIVYARERTRLRDLARRIVRTHDRADDVVHDAFAQILRDAKNFDPARGSAHAWIHSIVRHTALKRLHNDARELAVEDSMLLSIFDRQEYVRPFTRVDEYDDLRECLVALDPRRRASLILAIVDGRTHSEIATLLGVPIGTVKAWIRRELVALRRRLE